MNLRQKTIKGTFWSAVERFSVQGIQFVVQIIMARLLLPSDYGLIAMLAIFMAVAQTFIDGGFANALIQKKDRTEIDYSTVFYFNVLVGILLSFVFFFSAGIISTFYNMPELKEIIQVMSVNLFILSLQVVHKAKLTIKVDFKTQAKSSLISVLIAGAIGVYMAHNDFGVWSLVVQMIVMNFMQTVLLWSFERWKPLLVFSKQSFDKLFSFGSKILMSNLIHTLYLNLYTLVIGKKYSATDLGYYSRADQFAQFPSSNLTSILGRVTYPILSSIQDDNQKLREVYRHYIRLFAFVVFPLMIGLVTLAEPFVLLLLTDRWLGVVPLLQILCISYMWYPLNAVHQNLMQVKGRSDLFFRLEVIKKIIGILLLLLVLPFGVKSLCISLVLYSLISLGINTYFASRLIDFSIKEQLLDILRILIVSILMGIIVFVVNYLPLCSIYKILLGLIFGTCSYVLFAKILKMQEFSYLCQLIKKK